MSSLIEWIIKSNIKDDITLVVQSMESALLLNFWWFCNAPASFPAQQSTKRRKIYVHVLINKKVKYFQNVFKKITSQPRVLKLLYDNYEVPYVKRQLFSSVWWKYWNINNISYSRVCVLFYMKEMRNLIIQSHSFKNTVVPLKYALLCCKCRSLMQNGLFLELLHSL